MSTFSEQFSAARKSTVEAQLEYLRSLGQTAVESTEKVLALNLNASRTSLEKSSAAARQMLEVKSPADFGAFTQAAQDSFTTMLAYGRELLSIAAATQTELLKPAPVAALSAAPLNRSLVEAGEAMAAAAATATRVATDAASSVTGGGGKSAADYTADAARAAAQSLAEDAAATAQQAGRAIETAGQTLADATANTFGFGRPTAGPEAADATATAADAAGRSVAAAAQAASAPAAEAAKPLDVAAEQVGANVEQGAKLMEQASAQGAQADSGASEGNTTGQASTVPAPIHVDALTSPASSSDETLVEQVAEQQAMAIEAHPQIPAPEPVAKPKPVAKAVGKTAKQGNTKPAAAEIPAIDVRQVKVNGLKPIESDLPGAAVQSHLDLPSPKGGRSRK